MTQVNQGDTIKVHLKGTLTDGTVFVSSYEKNEPLEIRVGDGNIFSAVETEIVGMSPGEKKDIKLSPEQAFGPYREEHVVEVEKAILPDNINPQVGMMLEKVEQNGQKIQLAVTDVSETTVTLDANHPLAGKDLNFSVEVIEKS